MPENRNDHQGVESDVDNVACNAQRKLFFFTTLHMKLLTLKHTHLLLACARAPCPARSERQPLHSRTWCQRTYNWCVVAGDILTANIPNSFFKWLSTRLFTSDGRSSEASLRSSNVLHHSPRWTALCRGDSKLPPSSRHDTWSAKRSASQPAEQQVASWGRHSWICVRFLKSCPPVVSENGASLPNIALSGYTKHMPRTQGLAFINWLTLVRTARHSTLKTILKRNSHVVSINNRCTKARSIAKCCDKPHQDIALKDGLNIELNPFLND